jgi:TRAP-type C4-dicarboxylate transport system permease small subunit
LSFYKKTVNKICGAFEIFAVLCLAAMVVAVLVQVTGRYVFSSTPAWTEEMARQFMIVFSFIGISIGVRDKIHIGLTFVVDSLDNKIRLPIEILGKFLVIILGIMMSVNMGLLFSTLRYNRLPGTGIPILVIYVFPTAIGILLAFIAAYQIYDHFKLGTDEEQARQEEIANGEASV